MKKMMNWFKRNAWKVTNAFALLLVIQTANTSCTWYAYQPEFPEEAYRFKK